MKEENPKQLRKRPKILEWAIRVIEIVVSLVLLILLLPIFAVIGIWIKLESGGPAFFLQTRGGKDNRHFTIYKFRTMYVGKQTENALLETDSLITGAGKFLRRTSLDELPQLFNILKGDMSFIGPRPTVTSQTDHYNDYQKKRLLIKPGVTGLAQVSGRNELSWDEKIDLDIDYITRRSLRLDFYILLLTVYKVVKTEGVYVNEENGEDESQEAKKLSLKTVDKQ